MSRSLGAGIVLAAGATIAGALYRRSRTADGNDTGAERVITVGRTPAELRAAWLDLLPQTMEPFADVRIEAGGKIAWALRPPLQQRFETDVMDSAAALRWHTAPGAERSFGGDVRFTAAPGDRGSEVRLTLEASLPRVFAKAGSRTALRRFKSLVETGELPSLERNPSGRQTPAA